MEKEKNISMGLIMGLAIFAFLLALALGYVIGSGIFTKRNDTVVESNDAKKDVDTIDIENILALTLIKHDTDNVSGYKAKELTDADINTVIANYLFMYGDAIDDGAKFQYKALELEEKITHLFGLDNYKFDVSKGSIYTEHTLKEIDKDDVRYYEIERNADSNAMNGDNFHYWVLKNLHYKGNELIVEVEIEQSEIETTYHNILGLAKITYNIEDGVVLKNFAFNKYANPLKVDTSGLH